MIIIILLLLFLVINDSAPFRASAPSSVRRCLLQFEYQQAQLEAEVENLSWKVERAKITHRGVR